MPLPSVKEEVWRYSPIDTLDLDAYRPASPPEGASVDLLAQALWTGSPPTWQSVVPWWLSTMAARSPSTAPVSPTG